MHKTKKMNLGVGGGGEVDSHFSEILIRESDITYNEI